MIAASAAASAAAVAATRRKTSPAALANSPGWPATARSGIGPGFGGTRLSPGVAVAVAVAVGGAWGGGGPGRRGTDQVAPCRAVREHRVGVRVPGGVGGRPDLREGVQQVGAEDRLDRAGHRLPFVRSEDPGLPAGQDQGGRLCRIPAVGGGRPLQVRHHQAAHAGPQEPPVTGAPGQVRGFGAGLLQDLRRLVSGRAAHVSRGSRAPPAVGGVRGLVDEGPQAAGYRSA